MFAYIPRDRHGINAKNRSLITIIAEEVPEDIGHVIPAGNPELAVLCLRWMETLD